MAFKLSAEELDEIAALAIPTGVGILIYRGLIREHIRALEEENHVLRTDAEMPYGLLKNCQRQAEALKDEVCRLHKEIIDLKDFMKEARE